MRILIITAYDRRKASLGHQFAAHVKSCFKSLRHSHEQFTFIVRRHSELGEFVPDPHAQHDPADVARGRACISAFDGLDMIFLDGDERLLPWAPDALPLLQLMHMCCTSGKCMLGCGCAVQLMTYLASVGPTTLAVVNGPAAVGQTVGAAATGGAGSHVSVHDGDDGGAPSSPPLTPRGGSGGAPADGVWLENRTGDIFRHDLNERAWVPIGNVGLHCSFGSLSGAAHARSEINRSDGVGTAEIAVLARHHPIFAGVNHPPKLVVSQRNQWHSHLSGGAAAITVPTGMHALRVLATSSLGAQIVECRHLVGLQFRPDSKHPATVQLLRNFVAHSSAILTGELPSADPPRRITEMAAREAQYSDLLQQLVKSLAAGGGEMATVFASSAASVALSAAPTARLRLRLRIRLGARRRRRAAGVARPASGPRASLGATGGGGGSARPRPSSARSTLSSTVGASSVAGSAATTRPGSAAASFRVAPSSALTVPHRVAPRARDRHPPAPRPPRDAAWAELAGAERAVPLYAARGRAPSRRAPTAAAPDRPPRELGGRRVPLARLDP